MVIKLSAHNLFSDLAAGGEVKKNWELKVKIRDIYASILYMKVFFVQ